MSSFCKSGRLLCTSRFASCLMVSDMEQRLKRVGRARIKIPLKTRKEAKKPEIDRIVSGGNHCGFPERIFTRSKSSDRVTGVRKVVR